MTGIKYYIGIDPIDPENSQSFMVVFKKTDDGFEVVKTVNQFGKYAWFRKIKWKFYLWRLKRFYGIQVMKETNEPNKATEYFKNKK